MSRARLRLKRGDQVRVISGKFRGSEGKIMAVLPEANRVVIENVNIIKKAQRPTQDNPRGGFSEREAAIHASNVQLLDPQTGELSRIGYRRDPESGRKLRVSTKSGSVLEERS